MSNTIKSAFQNISFRNAFILTVLFFGIGVLFMVAGIKTYDEGIFIVLPITLGLSLGFLPEAGKMMVGSLIGIVCVSIIVMALQVEALICIVLSVFILIPSMAVGLLISYLVKKRIKRNDGRLSILLLPLLIFFIDSFFNYMVHVKSSQLMDVTSTRIYPYEPTKVFDVIKSMDTLTGPKPFLMQLGMPVPVKCVLESEQKGGQRICYFNEGTIVESITEFERGEILKMEVIECNLMINKWMHFQEAIYIFEETKDHQCKLTRITTYKSDLRPRFYWKIIEGIAINQEHKYVLNNLQAGLHNSSTQ